MGSLLLALGDEAWEKLGGTGFLIQQEWPKFDEALTIDAVVTLAVQVNGKLRGTVEVRAPGSLPSDGKVIEDRRRYD